MIPDHHSALPLPAIPQEPPPPRDASKLFHERLLRLPENIFLDLARNWLGDVQTPFNKHEILGRLESWLRTPEVHQRVRDFLSLRERRILTVLRTLGSATEETLYGFLGADYSRLDFHLKLLNLEDRMLVFRDPDSDGVKTFLLVPHFLPAIDSLLDRNLLLPSTMAPGPALPRMGLDHLAAAALACFDAMTLPVNRKGEFRKRERTELGRRLEPLARERNLDESGLDRFIHHLLRGLHHLGLLQVQGGHLWINHERLQSFASLGAPQRSALFCAAALFPEPEQLKRNPEDENPEYFSLRRIHDFALKQETFLGLFDPREVYEAPALDTLLALAGCTGSSLSAQDWAQGLSDLERLRRTEAGWQRTEAPQARSTEPSTPVQARVEGNFVVTIMGEPELGTLVALAQSAELQAFGPSSRWILQKERFQRWLSHGGSLTELLESLERMGSPSIPQNIRFTLEAWENDQGSLEFMDGVLLVAQGKRQTILEHLPGLEQWILARPAPGILLLDRSGQDSWIKILKEADFSTSAWEERQRHHSLMLPDFRSLDLANLSEPALPSHHELLRAESGTQTEATTAATNMRPRIIQELLAGLDDVSASEEIRLEMRQRIQDGLILLPSQLVAQAVRVDRLEAGGLDYQGKRRIIDQVIKSGRDFLEISLIGDEDFSAPRVVLPTSIKTSGTEQILLARTVPEGRELSFMIRKILRIKRVRSGFFF